MRQLLAAALAALLLAPSAGAWTWPVQGAVLRGFSLGSDPYAGGQHRGLDVAAPVGAAVRAPAAGTVTFVGAVPDGGRAVTIRTADDFAVTLLQLAASSVARGDVVAEGATVGVVGDSVDRVTREPHVHLGVRRWDEPEGYVDPLALLPVRPEAAPAPTMSEPAPALTPAATPASAPGGAAPAEAAPAEATPTATALAVEGPPVSPAVPAVPTVPPAAKPGVPRLDRQPFVGQPTAPRSVAEQRQRIRGHAADPVPGTRPRPAPVPRTQERRRADSGAATPAKLAQRLERTGEPPTSNLAEPAEARAPARAGAGAERAVSPLRTPDLPLARTSDGADTSGVSTWAAVAVGAVGVAAAALGLLLVRRRELVGDARIMGRDDRGPATAEDPGSGRVAVCERPAPHRPRGGVRGARPTSSRATTASRATTC